MVHPTVTGDLGERLDGSLSAAGHCCRGYCYLKSGETLGSDTELLEPADRECWSGAATYVMAFGCLYDDPIHTHRRQAYEKGGKGQNREILIISTGTDAFDSIDPHTLRSGSRIWRARDDMEYRDSPDEGSASPAWLRSHRRQTRRRSPGQSRDLAYLTAKRSIGLHLASITIAAVVRVSPDCVCRPYR